MTNMKPLKANTIIIGALPGERVEIECPARPIVHRAVKDTLPTCNVTGKGQYAEVVIRWTIMPFWRSKYYISELPRLWELIRQAYNEDGILVNPDVIIESGNTIVNGKGLIMEADYGKHDTFWMWSVNSTQPYKPPEDASGFCFPTELDPYWRLHFFVRRTDEPRFQITDGYLQYWFDKDAFHSGLGSHWSVKIPPAEDFPYRDQIEGVIELWKIKEPRRWRYEAHFSTRAGRWGDLYVWELGINTRPAPVVKEGAYGYKNGGKAHPIKRLVVGGED